MRTTAPLSPDCQKLCELLRVCASLAVLQQASNSSMRALPQPALRLRIADLDAVARTQRLQTLRQQGFGAFALEGVANGVLHLRQCRCVGPLPCLQLQDEKR